MQFEVFSLGRMPKVSVTSIGGADEQKYTKSGPILRSSFVIHYCFAGRGYFLQNPVRAGEGFIFLPGDTVEYHPSQSDPWEYLWFIIETEDMDFFIDFYNADKETGIFRYDFPHVIEEQFRALKRKTVLSISPLETLSIYLNILMRHSAPSRSSSMAKIYAVSAKEYIESNYYLHPSIGELAKHLNISQSYLYRVFFEEYGISPKEYLSRFCMEQAKALLRSSDMNISQIAASVGYNDVLSFSSFFSKRKGCSPTEYRNRTRDIITKQ